MKIITPQVNQTGEVRLLSKLLNQKVDTVRCMCSRGKTLTVQGLWVCKKTGSLVEMHLQALELLTFRYAYKTVLNQSKQKKKKRAEAVRCRWTLTSTLLFTHLQFMSSHYRQPPPCCLTSTASWRGRDGVRRRTKRRKRSLWARCTSSLWPSNGVDHQEDSFWQVFDTTEEYVLNSSRWSWWSE